MSHPALSDRISSRHIPSRPISSGLVGPVVSRLIPSRLGGSNRSPTHQVLSRPVKSGWSRQNASYLAMSCRIESDQTTPRLVSLVLCRHVISHQNLPSRVGRITSHQVGSRRIAARSRLVESHWSCLVLSGHGASHRIKSCPTHLVMSHRAKSGLVGHAMSRPIVPNRAPARRPKARDVSAPRDSSIRGPRCSRSSFCRRLVAGSALASSCPEVAALAQRRGDAVPH